MNVLFVAGVMRLDESVTVSSTSTGFTEPEFDAWPTKEGLQKIRREHREYFSRSGITNPFASQYDTDSELESDY